jgi:hypothetical protein
MSGRAMGLRVVFEQAEDFRETGRHGRKRSEMKDERRRMDDGRRRTRVLASPINAAGGSAGAASGRPWRRRRGRRPRRR